MEVSGAVGRARQERLRIALLPASARSARLGELADEWAAASRDERAVATLRLASAQVALGLEGRAPRGIVVADVRGAADLTLARLVGACVGAGAPLVLCGGTHDPVEDARFGVIAAEGDPADVPEVDDIVVLAEPVPAPTVVVLPHAETESALAAIVAADELGRVLVPAEAAQDVAFALQRRLSSAATASPERGRRLDAAVAEGAMPLSDPSAAGPVVVLCPDAMSSLLAHPVGDGVVPVLPCGAPEEAVALTHRWRPDLVWLFGEHADHTRRVAQALDAGLVAINPAGDDDAAALQLLGDRVSRSRRLLWR